MSGADDQRGAEPEIDWKAAYEGVVGDAARLQYVERELAEATVSAKTWEDKFRRVRDQLQGEADAHATTLAELAETRDRRDYLQGQLDIIYDAEYSRNDALLRRIEKMGTAGDNLAGELDRPAGTEPEVRALIDRWRSVRGDAPTQPPADPGDVAEEGDVMRWDQDGDLYRVIPAQPGDEQASSGEVWVTRHLDPLIGAARLPVAELSLVERRPAVARTDGQPPAAGVSVPQKSTESTADSLLDAGFAVASVLDTALADVPMPAEMEQDAIRVLTAWRVAADRPAAAGATAAPDVQVWQSDDGDWGWACARCDYQSVPWWSDRAVAERAAVEHGRDHCPARGSAPASTDGETDA